MLTEEPRDFDRDMVSKHEVFEAVHTYNVPFSLRSGYQIAEGPLPLSILYLTPSRIFFFQSDSLTASELFRLEVKTLFYTLLPIEFSSGDQSRYSFEASFLAVAAKKSKGAKSSFFKIKTSCCECSLEPVQTQTEFSGQIEQVELFTKAEDQIQIGIKGEEGLQLLRYFPGENVLKREEISRSLGIPIIEIFNFQKDQIIISSDLQRYNLKKVNQKYSLKFSDEQVNTEGVFEIQETQDFIFLKTF